MSLLEGLRCRECGRVYPLEPIYICEYCFGPLEVIFNYQEIDKRVTREAIRARKLNMWRYREFLPIDGKPIAGLETGFTPLIKAENLGKALGVTDLYIKNDAVSHPTLSFKDRVVAVALSKAKEFGFDIVACASTGNLANSLAAQATASRLRSFIFMPADLEQGKVMGTQVYGINLIGITGNYDEVNRLCSDIAGKYGWAFVNINLRPFYAEGSKTLAFEIMEQLNWRIPQHIVAPMAGGSLVTKIGKAINEFRTLSLVDESDCRLYGGQAKGCAPIVTAVHEHSELIKPVKPKTIAKSLAIGNPADGYYAVKTIQESGGWAEAVSDAEIVDGIKLLAETEGIFTETAGGVTVAATRHLIKSGRIPPDETTVICITGNGLKTQEALVGKLGKTEIIAAKLSEFDALVAEKKLKVVA